MFLASCVCINRCFSYIFKGAQVALNHICHIVLSTFSWLRWAYDALFVIAGAGREWMGFWTFWTIVAPGVSIILILNWVRLISSSYLCFNTELGVAGMKITGQWPQKVSDLKVID